MGTVAALRRSLRVRASPRDAAAARRFFKTGPGEYGEGDRFLGVRVPELRRLARAASEATIADAVRLLRSAWHEERLLALLLLVRLYERGGPQDRQSVYETYLGHTRYVNNWDLVDASAHLIVGAHLASRSKRPLGVLARSADLWERRIAIIATLAYIRRRRYGETMRIARLLLDDGHDLIHKATGWMLREVGNRDRQVAQAFLDRHYRRMPRTMLRYAIERFPETLRRGYLDAPRPGGRGRRT